MKIHLQRQSLPNTSNLSYDKYVKAFQRTFLALFILFACAFNKTVGQVINNVTVTGAPFCEGGNVTVRFNAVNGTGVANYFKISTSYQAYLYNSAGTWQTLGAPFTVVVPYASGDGATTLNLTKVLVLPNPLPTFTGYRIALTSTSPTSTGAIGSNGSADFTVGGTPAVSIVSNDADNNICSGTSVTFTATPVNGGTTPSYQWYVNTTPVGTNSPTYTSTTLANTNQVSVVMTSSSTCVSPTTATSNSITMTVNTSVVPSISITPLTVNICNGTSTTFIANTPTNGGLSPAYQWQSSTNGGGLYSDIASATAASHTTTTLVNNEMIRVKLTSSSACAVPNPVYSNAVTATVTPQPTASNAGVDQDICGTTTSLNGNTPAVGSGVWLIISGAGGTITSPSNRTSSFSGVAGTTYVLRWSISNGPCTPSTDDVTISFKTVPSTSSAGVDQSICGNTATLAANTPTSGTGLWTIQSGSGGSFSNATLPTSTFTGTAGTNYILRWTIANSPCAASTDDVLINFIANPSIADAGNNQNVCGGTITLAGNIPASGTGLWSIVSGAGGNLSNPAAHNSTFSGVPNTTYVLSWTISNNPCASTTDNVTITFRGGPTAAVAGPDQVGSAICGLTTVTLSGNNPAVGTGLWTIISGTGGSFGNASSPTSSFSGMAGETYVLRWTVSNNPCIETWDEVTVTFNRNPTIANAGADQITSATCGGSVVTLAANTATVGTGNWSIVTGGAGTFSNAANAASTFTGTAGATYVLRWTISNAPCAPSTDDVTVTFNVNPTAANAGPDKTAAMTCGTTSVTMAANNPTSGSGAWTIISGTGGSFSNATAYNSSFSGTAGATYILRWTVTNNPCPASTDDVSVTFGENPTPSNAGPDQISSTTCGLTNVTLAANTPSVGTGSWSIVSGAGGLINSISSPTSTFSGTAGITYVLRWTVTSTSCGTSTDDVAITFNTRPTPTFTTSPAASTCVNTSYTYTTQPGQTNYIWTLPGSAGVDYTIISGSVSTSSNTVTIQWLTAGSKTVAVNYNNAGGCNGATSATNTTNVNLIVAPSVSIVATTQVICTGTSVTFTATPVNGGTAPSYQWKVNGANVGANSSTYTSATLTHGQIVTVVMTSNAPCPSTATATSNALTMSVYASAAAAIANNSITGPTSICPPATVTYTVAAVARAENYIWNLPTGFNITSGQGTNSITVSVTNAANIQNNQDITVYAANPCGTGNPKTLNVNVNSFAGINAGADINVCSGSIAILAGVWSGNTSASTWTAPSGTFSNPSLVDAIYTPGITSGTVTLTLTTNDPSGVCSSASDQVNINVYLPPTITAQPVAARTICSGSTTTFSVTATGSGLTYQWRKGTIDLINGANISGATTSTLTLTNTTVADAGSYNVVVSGLAPCAFVTSNNSVLNVNEIVTITSQPVSLTRCTGGSATFSVAATGSGLSYQWYNGASIVTDGGSISGATTATLTINPVGLSHATSDYHVVITGVAPCSPVTSNIVSLTVNDAAVITVQPVATQAVCSGSTVTFTVTATGSGLTYQWRKGSTNLVNGGNVSGATTQTLSLTNASIADAGSYNVIVNGIAPCGSITSNNSVLTVNQIIAISSQPVSLTRCTGGNAVFNVVASGTGLTYQWYQGASIVTDGSGISGATTATLTINPVAMIHASSDYHVVISGTAPCSSLNSSVVSLTVNDAPVITAQPVATQTVCSGSTVTLSITATGSGLTYQWRKGSTNLSNGGNISGVATQTLTLSNVNLADAGSYNVIISGIAPCVPVTSNNSVLTINEIVTISNQPASLTRCTGATAVFGVTATGTGLNYQWYKGSSIVTDGAGISGATTATLTINPVSLSDASSDYHVVITGTSPCTPLTSSIVSLTVNDAPSITLQPLASQSVCSGSTVTFNVTATGSGLTYQWRKGTTNLTNGGNIAGATSSTLTLSGATVADGGSYNVIISGLAPCGPVTSNTSVLTVNQIIAISAQPVSLNMCTGGTAVFSVSATGTGLTYQWYKGSSLVTDGSGITGATTQTLTISPVAMSDASTDYHVVITGAAPCAPVTSSIVSLTVNQGPVITVQPLASQSFCEGSTATISVTVTGSGLTYQWRKGTTNLTDGGNISGVTTTTLTITNVSTSDAATDYNLVITAVSPCVNVTSQSAALIVNTGVTINTQPSNIGVCASNPAVIGVIASGSGLTYQWYKGTFPGTAVANSSTITGAQSNILNFSQANTVDEGIYYVLISGLAPCPSVRSNEVTLNIDESILISSQPTGATVCSDAGSVTFTVVADAGGSTLQYQWRKNGANISGATSASYTIASVSVASSGNYDVVISGPTGYTCTTVTSAVAVLVVNPFSTITSVSSNNLCSGNTQSYAITSSVAGTTYNWSRATLAGITQPGITGQTSNSITEVLTNTTSAPIDVIYSIVATYNGCTSPAFTYTVTVYPTPSVNAVADQVVCAGASVTALAFTGATSGTVYNWVNTNTAIGLTANGNGNIPAFTALNATGAPITATLTVTPTFTSGAVTCTGAAITFTITVNPAPAVGSISNQTLCNNTPTTAINFTGVATSFNWTNSSTLIGLAASGSGNIASFTATNTGTTALNATIQVTPVYINAGLTCTGSTQSASITVNPVPTVNTITDLTVCHNAVVPASVLTGSMGATAIYTWTNSNTAIGLAASGTGNIPSFTAINTGSVFATATIVVTPSYLNNGVQCTGTATTFTITVNPSPTVNSQANQTVCHNTTTTAITFTGSATGASYGWTNTDNTIGLASSGTGDIASFTAINAGTTVKTATITVTPTYTNNGFTCTGSPITFTIVVNPPAAVNTITDKTSCHNGSIAATTFSGNITGGVYNWTNSNPSIGLAASGTGNLPAFTATNNGTALVSALITVTPAFTNGALTCNGTPTSFTINVLPRPTAAAVDSQTLCNNTSTTTINFSGTVAGTIYNWTNTNTSIGLAASGNSDINAFTALNSGTTPLTASIQVTPTYVVGGTTCTGTAQSFSFVVNPSPTVNAVATQSVCHNVATTSIALSGAVPGTVYNWTNSNSAVGLAANGTGNIPVFTPVNIGNSIINATLTLTGSYTNAGLTCSTTPMVVGLQVAPKSVGGSVMVDGTSPSANVKVVCPAVIPTYTNSVSLTVSGFTGSVDRWQSSLDGGTTWTNRAATSTNITFTNILVTTVYRAVIKSGACSEAYSQMAVINVIPPYPPAPVTATPSTICAGQTTVLTAQIGYPMTGITSSGGDFDNANPEGWAVDGQTTGSFLPAAGDNTNPGPWQETNGPKVFQGVTYDTYDNNKFAITSGAFTSTMETPVFSLIATSIANLDFWHAYRLQPGASVAIEVSTDSGFNYPHVIHSASGPIDYGINASNVAVLQHVYIPLTNYMGQKNVRVRFKYIGNSGSSWAVDGIRVPTTNFPNAYIWTDTTSVPTISGTQGNTVTATPYMTTTYMIATTVGSCPGGLQPVTVTVNPGPSLSYGQAPPVCQSANAQSTTINISNLVNNPNQYSITWNATPANNFAAVTNAALPPGAITIPIPAGTPAGVYTGSIQVKNANTCFSIPHTFSITVNPRPMASLADTTTICLGSSATFPISLLGSGNFTGTLTNGLAFGPTTSNSLPITVSPTVTTTYSLASLTNGTCASIASDLTGTHTVKVNIPVAISAQPSTNDICYHSDAIITSSSTGTVASNQWQVSTDNGATWTDITNGTRYSGATTGTLTVIDPPLAAVDHMYRNKVTSPPPCNDNLTTNSTKLKIRNVWLGTVDTDWQNGLNWSHGQPASPICDTTHILNRSNQPTLNSGTSYNTNLLIYPGAYLTLANQPSTFIAIAASTINNGGTFNALDGRVMLNGTIQHQTLTGSTFLNRTLNYLTVANSTATGASLAGAPDSDTLYISNHIDFGNVNGRTFTTNSNLTLMSRAWRTASVGDLTNNNTNTLNIISGRVTVERYIPSRKAWRYLSVATTGPETFREYWQERNNVANANIYPGYGTTITSGTPSTFAAGGFDTYSLTGPSVKIYNATTNDYDGIPNVWIPMSTPRGLMTFVRGNRSATTFYDPPSSTIMRHAGILKQGTQAPLPVLPNTFTDFGNPYASAIDMRKIDKPGVQDIFYIWDPTMYGGFGLGAWKTFSYSNGNYYPTPGGGAYGSGPQNFIESGLAFIVRGSTGGSVNFDETDKDLSTRMVFRAGADPQQLRATVMIDTTVMDGILVDYGNWSNSVDYDDAIKLRNNNENVASYRENKFLSVERRNQIVDTDTVFLRFTGTRIQNNYKWSIELKNMDSAGRTAYLLDSYLNSSTPLNLNGTTVYPFIVANIAGTYQPERFKIVFVQANATFITRVEAKRNSDRSVKVDWDVKNEEGSYQYTTERSADGIQFSGIITTESRGNNLRTKAAYSVNDLGASELDNFYRIKGTGPAGQVITSAVVKVGEIPAVAKSEISVYPNPVVGRTMNMNFVNQAFGSYQLRILSQDGKSLFSKTLTINTKNENVKWAIGFVSAGSYVLEVVSPSGEKSRRSLFIQ